MHREAAPLITLLTDFGDGGGYVGMMKGVIYARHPAARIVDLTHAVAPQAIREGAFLLHTAYTAFPPDTIHVAVVDPGVGTTRRALCLDAPGAGCFIGPDNGLFSYILAAHPQLAAYEITNPAYLRQPVSRTFHGRDIFAPVAAHLARGAPHATVGPRVDPASLIHLPNLWPDWDGDPRSGGAIIGEVVHIDRFGNLIATIAHDRFAGFTPADLAATTVAVGDLLARGIAATYGEAAPGSLIALFGSSGFLELARVNGRAAPTANSDEPNPTLGLPVRVALAARVP